MEVVHVFTGLCFRKKENAATFTAARNDTDSSEENGNRGQTDEQQQKDQEMMIGRLFILTSVKYFFGLHVNRREV